MSIYTVALFLHILGAFGFFIGLAMSWLCLGALARVRSAEQAQTWTEVGSRIKAIMISSTLAVFVTGVYMSVILRSSGHAIGWIAVALAALIVVSILGAGVEGRRIEAYRAQVAGMSGPLPEKLRSQLADPILMRVLRVNTGLGLGIVMLMVFKPSLWASFLVVVALAVLGYLWSLAPSKSKFNKTQSRLQHKHHTS